jgi:hypothetical protein
MQACAAYIAGRLYYKAAERTSLEDSTTRLQSPHHWKTLLPGYKAHIARRLYCKAAKPTSLEDCTARLWSLHCWEICIYGRLYCKAAEPTLLGDLTTSLRGPHCSETQLSFGDHSFHSKTKFF